MVPPQLSCGLDFNSAPDVQLCIEEINANSFKFLSIPIAHPRFRRSYVVGEAVKKGFTRSDLLLSTSDWNVKVVGKLSPYLDVDSPVDEVQQRYEDAMIEELSYGRGLLAAVMLELKSDVCTNLARILTNHFAQGCVNPCPIWVSVRADDEGWQRWSKLHELLNWDTRVGVVLRIPADLPEDEVLRRWFGEPLKCIMLATSLFRSNKKGYPVLGRSHATLAARMTQRGVQAMVCGARMYQPSHYYNYLAHVHATYETRDYFQCYDRKTIVAMDNYASGWEDYLQMPLQPLSDNLDAVTYNVFEKDPIKYNQYQAAIMEILKDFKENGFKEPKVPDPPGVILKNTPVVENGMDEDDDKINGKVTTIGTADSPAVVMVLGAGRGPLVRAVLNAALAADVVVKVYAVEKNPSAVVTLCAQAKELWGGQVEVVAGDMRRIKPPQPAHLIVSELLGSWGDNELSPECLWGARSLVAKGGHSIPCRYTSYLAPLHSPTMWNTASTYRSSPSGGGITGIHSIHDGLQAIWVVYMRRKFDIAEPKPVFTFEHPPETGSTDPNIEDSRRKVTLEWKSSQDCVMHGFSGYFHADLTENVNISILPSNHSSGMISWFPVFIPIRCPFRVAIGDTIRATFWRRSDHGRVWYEWAVSVETVAANGKTFLRSSIVHNANGQISFMNL